MMEDSQSTRIISNVKVLGIRKRRIPSKHYVYIICVLRSDGVKCFILRRFRQLCELQDNLSELIAQEYEQVLPQLPEKIVIGRSHIRKVAEERKLEIEKYLQDLVQLPPAISQSEVVLNFFNTTKDDVHFWTVSDRNAELQYSAKEISVPYDMEKYVSIHDYKAQSANDISMSRGDEVSVIKKMDIGWWYVQLASSRGWVPAAYLQSKDEMVEDANTVVEQQQKAVNVEDELYIAKKSHTPSTTLPKGSSEMRLVPGMIVNVVRKSHDGWWLAHSTDGSVGFVPGCYLVPVDRPKAFDLIRLLPEICTPALLTRWVDPNGQPINHCEINIIQGYARFTKADGPC